VIGISRWPLVLAYHGVGIVDNDVDPERLVVSPIHLEQQVRLLQRRGYRFATAEELIGAKRTHGRVVALTFDDGFRSSLTVAAPLLRQLGVSATFYVSPGMWSRQHPSVAGEAGRLLAADEARELTEYGMELGSHGFSHLDLSSLEDDALRRELVDSKLALEQLAGRPCRTLAYPYGFAGERVVASARAAGYELAFMWLPGRWRELEAPRLPGPPRHGAGRLRLKLIGLRKPGR
jgi:peptidoglycan/xylan/chitin deacetylase (PgdA/CDA1 family)